MKKLVTSLICICMILTLASGCGCDKKKTSDGIIKNVNDLTDNVGNPPMTVKISGEELTVIRKLTDIEVPDGYKKGKIIINGVEVECLINEKDGTILILLRDANGNLYFYKYENNKYTLYQKYEGKIGNNSNGSNSSKKNSNNGSGNNSGSENNSGNSSNSGKSSNSSNGTKTYKQIQQENEENAKCTVFKCLNNLTSNSTLAEINKTIGFEGTKGTDDSEWTAYTWRLKEGEVRAIFYKTTKNTSVSITVDNSVIKNNKVNISQADELRKKMLKGEKIEYKDIKEQFGKIDGTLLEINATGKKYRWVDKNNSYVDVIFASNSGRCISIFKK